MTGYRLSPSAKSDLDDIAEYIGEAAGSDIAARVIRGIREKCRLLGESSGTLGTARDELGEGIPSLPVSPYIVFFRYADDRAEIVRILHERRDIRGEMPDEE